MYNNKPKLTSIINTYNNPTHLPQTNNQTYDHTGNFQEYIVHLSDSENWILGNLLQSKIYLIFCIKD